jgi:hypothetical protein
MYDKHRDQSHAHLGHLVMVRVKHLGSVLAQGKFVFHCFPRLDEWLG